jgi:outer membrane protein OmpA-like peptidoglycan-associated protein
VKATPRLVLLLLLATIAFLGSATPSAAIRAYIVFFDRNSAVLTDEAKMVIAEVMYGIKSIQLPCTNVDLIGHTDGAEQSAKQLSLSRARAVRIELRRLGLPKSVVINVRGMGAAEMMVQVEGPEPQNRRVLIDWCPKELRELWRRYQPLPTRQ